VSQPFIVLGDRTSHGGTVISADYTTDIHGKYIARVGDLVVCPRKGCRGTFAITTGASDMIVTGAAPARHGDKTACGATLIASQAVTTWSAESSGGSASAGEASEALAAASSVAVHTDSGVCLDCLLKAAASGSSVVIRN
jgi:uncharacterized Zn-binding protein involved in type VI secretion